MKTVSTLSREYPWGRTKHGESFFVPTLDVRQVEIEGAQAAARLNLRAIKATPCVYKGLLGVMFKRP